jgi:ribose 5-phosphate isomerase
MSYKALKDVTKSNEIGIGYGSTVKNYLPRRLLSHYLTGNERKVVFKSKGDREKFLEYLESAPSGMTP